MNTDRTYGAFLLRSLANWSIFTFSAQYISIKLEVCEIMLKVSDNIAIKDNQVIKHAIILKHTMCRLSLLFSFL